MRWLILALRLRALGVACTKKSEQQIDKRTHGCLSESELDLEDEVCQFAYYCMTCRFIGKLAVVEFRQS